MYSMHLHIYSYIFNAYAYIFICIHFQMGNKDSAPVLRDEDVAVLCESSGLSEEVEIKFHFYEILLKSWRKLKKKKVCQSSRLSEVVDQKLYTYENNFQKFKKKTVCESSGLGEEVDQKTFHPHK